MISVAVLVASALVPTVVCRMLQSMFLREMPRDPAARARRVDKFRRTSLFGGALMVLASAVAGALVADEALLRPWPLASAWFFSTLCMATAWVAVALGQRTNEESEAMSSLEVAGRAVQTSALWFTAVAFASLATGLLLPALPWPPTLSAVVCGALAVWTTAILSPWLLMLVSIWPIYGSRLTVRGVSWRLAHLPAPHPFLTHVAAVPWLRTVLVTDGVMTRMPERYWRTLVAFEAGENAESQLERTQRWLIALPLASLAFVAAGAAGEGDPRKLVAGNTMAVAFALYALWAANRQPSTKVSLDLGDPSPRDLARTLRHLPPSHGQAMPQTSHQSLGPALYDRLFALGHDPGPRRR
ncbi:MAG: hypothetical protein AAGF92_09495 [Myxococcota bacterium]